MSEMVERVAHALSGQLSEAVGKPPYNPDEAIKWWNCVLRLAAEAAIEAMREPTDAMMDNGGDMAVWGAMIEAALAE